MLIGVPAEIWTGNFKNTNQITDIWADLLSANFLNNAFQLQRLQNIVYEDNNKLRIGNVVEGNGRGMSESLLQIFLQATSRRKHGIPREHTSLQLRIELDNGRLGCKAAIQQLNRQVCCRTYSKLNNWLDSYVLHRDNWVFGLCPSSITDWG
jgi:hypothetical protein